MSECVVRMEMPTENTACELNYYCYREWRCVITDKRCDHNKNGEFPSWCPIICQLPEGHGRLGDLDELGRKINGARIRAMQDGQDTNPYWECGDIIASEKTIIPAERSKI